MKKYRFYSFVCFVLFIFTVFLCYENMRMRKKVQAAQEQLQHMEVEQYIQSLPDLESLNIEQTTSGFLKKDGQYLLRTRDDLIRLAGMVNSGQKIEGGTLAANASYRLLADFEFDEGHKVEKIGTDEYPFNGTLDGDGHVISGYFSERAEEPVQYLFGNRSGTVVNLEVKNTFEALFISAGKNDLFSALLDAPFIVGRESSPDDLCITVENQEQCDALLKFLVTQYPEGSLYLTLDCQELDTVELARYIYQREMGGKEHIDVNQAQAGSTSMNGFLSIPSTVDISGGRPLQKDESLYFFRKEKVGGLSCCSYIYGTWEDWDEIDREAPPISVLVDGEWEGQDDFHQLFTVKFPSVTLNEIRRRGCYSIIMSDINYDGFEDLMLRTRVLNRQADFSYRSALWSEENKEFTFFSAMPEFVLAFDKSRERLIQRNHIGVTEETIIAFELLNGEYKETKRLKLISGTTGKYLYYYERGKLVDKREVESQEEVSDLYPDLDYWRKG